MTESYIEVLDILTYLRNTSGEVSVSFQGDDSTYPSIITALNAKHQIMVLDSQMPDTSIHLTRGTPITVRAEKQGREFTFNSKFLEPLASDFSLGYQLSIPSALGTAHPREAFRVLLDEIRDKVRITLHDAHKQPIDGIVRNISRSGLGMKTYAELPNTLAKESQIVDCNILLQETNEISCKMEIKNVTSKENGQNATFIGGRMLDVNQQDTNMLISFIKQLQQQHIQSYA